MLIDNKHPFYAPAWRRWTIIAVTFGWTALEWMTMSYFWAVLATAIALHALWTLVITFPSEKSPTDGTP